MSEIKFEIVKKIGDLTGFRESLSFRVSRPRRDQGQCW
jgi:hypothetical protein